MLHRIDFYHLIFKVPTQQGLEVFSGLRTAWAEARVVEGEGHKNVVILRIKAYIVAVCRSGRTTIVDRGTAENYHWFATC